MSDDRAQDRFEAYFAEKIWQMIPEVHRFEDGLGLHPDVLRALVETIATQAATLRRSADRLWDDSFIDLCDDWAVPYIGDLVAARLLSAMNPRGRRIDVAKTIYYRRRKGTLLVLEELTRDITGWDSHVVEGFRRLSRMHHALDPQPSDRLGPFTKTPFGGFPDLRHPRGAQLADRAFEEFHHMPDVRRHHGGIDGRHNISKLEMHVYRLDSVKLEKVTPFPLSTPGAFTFDPSGRDTHLFMKRGRDAGWHRAHEWDLPAPMECRVLGHAEYLATLDLALANPGVVPPELVGVRVANEQRVDAIVPSADAAWFRKNTIVEDCGKAALYPSSVAVRTQTTPPDFDILARERITSGNLQALATTVPFFDVVIDPVLGRLLFVPTNPLPDPNEVRVDYCYGFSGPIGAGGRPRTPLGGATTRAFVETMTFAPSDVLEITDSATYTIAGGSQNATSFVLRASDRQRPYVRLGPTGWTLQGTGDATLVLDGVWIGQMPGATNALTIAGDFARVHLRRMTLDPGGLDAEGNAIAPVSLVIDGSVKELVIEDSITGSIIVTAPGLVETLTIRRSIVQGIPYAIDAHTGVAVLDAVTIFGDVLVHRTQSTEVLVDGVMTAINAQDGCFRFGAAKTGSALPHPYESHILDDLSSVFRSRRFGDYDYAQLTRIAPAFIRRGGENLLEMGAFRDLHSPIKLDDLEKKVEEYMPFGLIPIFILET